MGLCRFLPIPSDRMGILWSLLTIKDSIVIEYGPAGTTHYSMSFLGNMGIEAENQIFTTHMSEEDVIMGDSTRLEESILELDAQFNPKVIFVLASSISSVIGTDLNGICKYMQSKVNAKLVTFSEGGLRGDYSAGLAKVYDVIAKNMISEPTEKESYKNTFNIIGSSMGVYRNKSDINEICNLMQAGFGFKLNNALCFNTSIEKIDKMANATINLVISEEGLESAKYLREKYNIPYIYGVPYGYKGTLAWLKEIETTIDKKLSTELEGNINGFIKETSFYRMYKMMMKTPLNIYIYADYNRALGLKTFFEDELFANVENSICIHSLKAIENNEEKIVHIENEGERVKILKSLTNTLVLADDVSNKLVDDTNITVCISQPSLKRPDIATHMPFVGINGANYLREIFEEYIKKGK